MEAFDVGLLPGCTRTDINGLDLLLCHPVSDGLSNKFRAIVAADVLRQPIMLDDRFDHPNRIGGPDRTPNLDGQTLLGEFVNESQNPQLRSVFQLIVNNVPAPNIIEVISSLASPVGCCQASGRSLLVANPKTFPASDTLNTLAIDSQAFTVNSLSDKSISAPGMLVAQFHDSILQFLVSAPHC